MVWHATIRLRSVHDINNDRLAQRVRDACAEREEGTENRDMD